jgi:hypothetical protein
MVGHEPGRNGRPGVSQDTLALLAKDTGEARNRRFPWQLVLEPRDPRRLAQGRANLPCCDGKTGTLLRLALSNAFA